MIRTLVIASLICKALIAASPVREVSSQAAIVANQSMPAFYKGYVFFVDDPGQDYVRLYAPDGHLALATGVQHQKPARVFTQGVAVDSDGTIAVPWAYGKEGGNTAQIDFLDGNGRLMNTIATGSYVASHVTFDSDHNVWTFGWDFQGHPLDLNSHDYMTVRKFSRDGKQLGAWLPRSLFPVGLHPSPESWQSTNITVTADRIGLLAYSGMVGSSQEWVELSPQGTLLGRWDVDATGGARVALTTDGHVYLQKGMGPRDVRLFTLDRTASKWTPVTAPMNGWMYGADGNDLVFSNWAHGPRSRNFHPNVITT